MKLAHDRVAVGIRPWTYLEGKLLQSNSQTRKRLISGTGLGDDGELGGRAMGISRGDLDAGDVSGLV